MCVKKRVEKEKIMEGRERDRGREERERERMKGKERESFRKSSL